MIRTKASVLKQAIVESSFQVVKDDSSKRKLPKTAAPKGSGNKSDSEDSEWERVFGDGPKKKSKKDKKEVTFQSARREIINLGIAGSTGSEKIELNQQLAIKLGAKPQKKVARNYKEILEEKRKQKEEDKTVNKRTLFGTSASLQYRNQKKFKSRKGDGLLKRYGKVEKESTEKHSSGKKNKPRKNDK